MEKIIEFSGQKITFRATMRTLLIYKRQTGREYLADAAELRKIISTGDDGKPLLDAKGKPIIDLAALNTEALCGVAWAMAKTADNSIPPMDDWLDQFDEFPMLEILTELFPMLSAAMKVDRKNG